MWFVYHHFWFLDIAIGGVPLQVLCQLLLLALLPAALLPGLIATGAHKDFINQQMLLQVLHPLGQWLLSLSKSSLTTKCTHC